MMLRLPDPAPDRPPCRPPRRGGRGARAWALAALGLALSACGGGGGGGGTSPPAATTCAAGGGPPMSVSGTVLYERLPVSAAGLGPALVTRPARFVDVELRSAGGGACWGRTSTDAAGAYVLAATPPAGSSLQVFAWSRTDEDPLRNVTVHDALPPASDSHGATNSFFHASAAFPSGGAPVVDLTVPYNPGSSTSRPSIGFAVLDTIVTCIEAIRTSTGVVPTLCHAYTRLGNAGSVGTSFYDHSVRALSVLGGAAGALDTSDTDYFDEAVVAHEYGHFVEFNLAATRNRGGFHGGQALEPCFAWSEGAATGWGCVMRADPSYVDTIRTSPFPPQFNTSVENWTPQSVRGIGGEETVSEIVWDLCDGTGGLASTDADGAAVSFGALYAQFLAYEPAEVLPYVGTLLDRAVSGAGVPAGTITALMGFPENQQITYPLAGDDVWPTALVLPASVNGTCDSLAGPNKNQCRGLTSSAWYQLTLAANTTVTIALDVQPTAGSGDNLNLYLESLPGGLLAQSVKSGANDEAIGPILLGPGKYVIRVEADCAGSGNHANFHLAVN